MQNTHTIILCCLMLACCSCFVFLPAHAFTANSLDITIDKNGDAVATFRFTLEGIVENAIPQSVLEEELKKGLTSGSEPPELISMDRSSAVLLLKKFATTTDVPTGTGYLTAQMDFSKAEIALQNSAIGGAVSADFSPESVVLTFPDAFEREFPNADLLPPVYHIVVDPSKPPRVETTSSGDNGGAAPATSGEKGFMNVTSLPQGVKVYLDSAYIGEAPAVFQNIPSGTHAVMFRKESYKTLTKNVTIIAGKTTNVLVVLEFIPPATTDDTASVPVVPLLILVIALAAIAGGGYYYWTETKKKNRLDGDDEAEPEDGGRQSPAVVAPVIPHPAVVEPEPPAPDTRNTVVRVTMLGEFSDQEPEKEDPENPGT